jgi:hypothetical protein
MALTSGASTRGATGSAKPYSNDIQLRTASVAILSRYGTRTRAWRPHPYVVRRGR